MDRTLEMHQAIKDFVNNKITGKEFYDIFVFGFAGEYIVSNDREQNYIWSVNEALYYAGDEHITDIVRKDGLYTYEDCREIIKVLFNTYINDPNITDFDELLTNEVKRIRNKM